MRYRIFIAVGLALASVAVRADHNSDIGYTQLQQELGAALPDGTGVAVTQVEGTLMVNGQSAWMPDFQDAAFAGKTIINESNAPAGLYSAHGTGVGRDFYGLTTSIAPGITNIAAYGANDWLGAGFLQTVLPDTTAPFEDPTPDVSTSRISNSSWIGTAVPFETYVLRRVDWVVETDEILHLVGLNNGDGVTASTAPLLASAYNVLAVGRSDSLHLVSTPALDSTYVAGRARPEIVDPINSTSSATPHVSAAAALLLQTGSANLCPLTDPVSSGMTNRAGVLVCNAQRSEVIKAALMAGADRVTHNSAPNPTNLALYRGAVANRTGNGLDRRYGAGQLNVRNSYWIIKGGEQNSTEDGNAGATVASSSFDYDPAFGGLNGSNSVATYPLPISNLPRLLTASLAWNLDISGPTADPPGPTRSNFVTTATLWDLDLAVIDLAAGGLPVMASSQSTLENTENLWFVVPANAQFALRVTRKSGFRWDYGLAWQLLNDTDADGAHDGQDNCSAAPNGPLVTDSGGLSQLDTNSDGYGNRCDPDFNNNGVVDSQDGSLFKAAFGSTAFPDRDLNGNGSVDSQDGAILKARFGQSPGPSALVP